MWIFLSKKRREDGRLVFPALTLVWLGYDELTGHGGGVDITAEEVGSRLRWRCEGVGGCARACNL